MRGWIFRHSAGEEARFERRPDGAAERRTERLPQQLDPPSSIRFVTKVSGGVDLVQIFATGAQSCARARRLSADAGARSVVWVSWPKKASKVPTDITEDIIRQVALALGFVDVKVCAVDEVWSGLKLVAAVKALR